jgi:redox-sensitive bicupin YhaK (pirin superfamily)
MQAGGGAWHGGNFGDGDGRVRGFQLWIALPPELELSEAISTYLAPHEIPTSGPVTVLLGQQGASSSSITPPSPINYLSVRLRAGERWTYTPPAGHTVAWAAVSTGELELPVTARAGEMIVFAPGEADIEFLAHSDAEFVLGSAVPHPHRLVSGQYSVHTTEAALREGEAHIDKIGRALVRRKD